jgi:diaminopimelate decarboxylase
MSRPAEVSSQQHVFLDPAEFTPHFAWRAAAGQRQAVAIEKLELAKLAEKYGTPLYVYSRAAIRDAFNELHRGLRVVPHTLCFAVKSNGNLSILRLLARLGSGFDVVSGNELLQLRHIGIPGPRIVFSGVGKTRDEIREALQYRAGRSAARGILLFNLESEAELEVLLAEASRRGVQRPALSVRVNPDVQAGGHPHISTGRHDHKFGLDWDAARRLYLGNRAVRWIEWQGISSHIGSQITSMPPFRQALARMAGFVKELRREGIALRYLDFGGGLGVRYTDQHPPSRREYARTVAGMVRNLGVHLLLEPGRTIIGPAAVLLTRVVYTKENRGKRFVIVDAGMNDLLRPSLYGAVHPITRVTRASKHSNAECRRADIVGPVCETGDCFLHDWPLGEVAPGETLAIWTAGAYGMSLASNYNARVRPAEVLVSGATSTLIRRRESFVDLLRGDALA